MRFLRTVWYQGVESFVVGSVNVPSVTQQPLPSPRSECDLSLVQGRAKGGQAPAYLSDAKRGPHSECSEDPGVEVQEDFV